MIKNIAKWFLPRIAEAVTKFPYDDRLSRFLDKLIVLSETAVRLGHEAENKRLF
jgi:hypothetical protein